MKKVISLLLCVVFLTLALVSCGGGTTNPEAERPNLTLRMAIIVDDKTTDAGVAAMQKAFNDECEVLLATHVEFECIKASDYRAQMDALMNKVQNAKNNASSNKEDAMANGTNQNSVNTYPAASDAQFDIVMIADSAMYQEYVENGWLISLDSHLEDTFRPIDTKILAAAKKLALVGDNGECYGIPANEAYGTYKYVMLNKEAFDHYKLDVNEITSLADAYKLIQQMEIADAENGLAKWQAKYPESFSVIRDTKDTFELPTVQYLTKDLKTPGLFGVAYNRAGTFLNISLQAKNLLKDDIYKRFITMKFDAEKSGYFSQTGTEENFLIGLAEGEYDLRYSNDDYYFIPIAYPTLDKEEVFSGMLAVSSFTVNAKRSLEVIQEMMINATRAGLLNIALYGDAETNYYMEDGCVSYRQMSNYGAHPDYLFGNLKEIAYPCENFGQTKDTYTYVAQQNTDLATELFGDDFANWMAEKAKIDEETWTAFDAYCAERYAELMACDTLAEFEAKIGELIQKMDQDPFFDNTDGKKSFALEDAYEDRWDYAYLGGCYYRYAADRKAALLGN